MTTPLSAEQIAELRELLEKATAGPWSLGRQNDERTWLREIDGDHWFALAEVVTVFDSPDAKRKLKMEAEGAANAALIVAAVNTLPAILDSLTASQERVKELQAELAKYGRDNCMGQDVEGCARWVREERLLASQERVKAAREALRPFAAIAQHLTDSRYGPAWGFNGGVIEHDDFRRAAQVHKELGDAE